MTSYNFVNNIIKQGNSMCVRIPSHIIKEGGLTEGMQAQIRIEPPEQLYTYNEKHIQTALNIANDIPSLKDIPELKKRVFIMMNFEFLKETTSSDQQEERERQATFLKKKRAEYGGKLIDEFLSFAQKLNQEAYVMEKGVAVLKKEFQHHLQ